MNDAPSNATAFASFLRLEIADALRSKWVALTLVIDIGLALAFVWLGLRESTVLGFTGLSRVLLNLAHAIIVIFPLVVLFATHAAIVRARSSGFCELMLTHPVKRSTWFAALVVSRLIMLIGPLLLLGLLGWLAIQFFPLEPESELGTVAAKSLAICSALLFAFIGMGLLISARSKSVERAIVLALTVFVVTAALQDMLLMSALLRTPMPPELVFGLAAINPVEAARVGILTSVDSELAVLGPVGFWLANTLGPTFAVGLGIAWPAVLGLLCTGLALRTVLRSDLLV